MEIKMTTTITAEYIMGIHEGRESLAKYGVIEFTASERIANLRSTIKGFSKNSPVGQMLRGELDFWVNQIKSNHN